MATAPPITRMVAAGPAPAPGPSRSDKIRRTKAQLADYKKKGGIGKTAKDMRRELGKLERSRKSANSKSNKPSSKMRKIASAARAGRKTALAAGEKGFSPKTKGERRTVVNNARATGAALARNVAAARGPAAGPAA